MYSDEPIFYVCSPFTHPDPAIMDARLDAVIRATVDLLQKNILCYSPIAYNGPWGKKYNLRTDWAFWEKFDKNLLERCDAVIVLMIDGWDASVGVKSELKYAEDDLRLKVFYVSQDQIDRDDISQLKNFVSSFRNFFGALA